MGFFDLDEVFDDFFVRFREESFEFLDRGSGEFDAMGHLFSLRTFGEIAVERDGRLVLPFLDDGRIPQVLGKILVLHQFADKRLPLRRFHRLKRSPKNLRCRL